MGQFDFSGIHLLAEFYGVANNMFLKKDIQKEVEDCCFKAGATCLKTDVHFFENGGYTLFSLLAESHIAVHTYIEHGAIFLDIFTCGKVDPEEMLKILENYYKPDRKTIKVIRRGWQ